MSRGETGMPERRAKRVSPQENELNDDDINRNGKIRWRTEWI
jgi:hypothetical protein